MQEFVVALEGLIGKDIVVQTTVDRFSGKVEKVTASYLYIDLGKQPRWVNLNHIVHFHSI